ncbi:MAG: hypothetical protein ACI9FY_001090, partial [Patiriisocius sp.]
PGPIVRTLMRVSSEKGYDCPCAVTMQSRRNKE